MNRLTLAALGVMAALAGQASYADDAKPVDPWAGPEVQDLVYLGDTRPVMLRLHIYVDGKPFSVRWDAYLKRLFAYLDRDDNGTLDRNEVSRAPSALIMQNQAQANGFLQGNSSPPPLGEMDADGDGKVTLDEFLRYYQRNGIGAIRIAGMPNASIQTNNLTQALFKALDVNKDGKLSRSELQAAEAALRKFDQDDDELISSQELLTTTAYNPYGQQQVMIDPRTGQMAAPPVPFLLIDREEPGQRLNNRLKAAKELLARYDKNKNGKLSRDELGFPKEMFALLKPDDNGEVDNIKLMRWLLALPDVELNFRIGKLEQGQLAVEVIDTGRKTVPTLPVHKPAASTLAMTLGRTNLNLVRVDGVQGSYTANYQQYYLQLFRQADKDKKGFLIAKQLDNPQFAILKQILKVADRDEDDKLTEKELTEYFEVMAGSGDAMTSLVFSDFGQGLFEMLDANRDGRLGRRELRQAWTRLAEYDQDGDGAITKEELPRQCQLTVTKGPTNNAYAFYQQQLALSQRGQFANQPAVQAPASGPLWFRKMDVNGDGDVSPREFLGSPEEFARIDEDGDGLISLEEAIKYDAKLRASQKPAK